MWRARETPSDDPSCQPSQRMARLPGFSVSGCLMFPGPDSQCGTTLLRLDSHRILGAESLIAIAGHVSFIAESRYSSASDTSPI